MKQIGQFVKSHPATHVRNAEPGPRPRSTNGHLYCKGTGFLMVNAGWKQAGIIPQGVDMARYFDQQNPVDEDGMMRCSCNDTGRNFRDAFGHRIEDHHFGDQIKAHLDGKKAAVVGEQVAKGHWSDGVEDPPESVLEDWI